MLCLLSAGCHSSHGNKSSAPIQSSLESSSVDQQNMFASGVPLTNVESPKYVFSSVFRLYHPYLLGNRACFYSIMQPVGGSYIAKAEAEKSEN